MEPGFKYGFVCEDTASAGKVFFTDMAAVAEEQKPILTEYTYYWLNIPTGETGEKKIWIVGDRHDGCFWALINKWNAASKEWKYWW